MAAVSKSMLVAAALLLVGFGAAGAVWAEPVSPNRVIRDPLVKHRPTYVDPLFSDAAKSATAGPAKAAVASAKAGKSSGKRFKFEVHCGQGQDKRGAGSTDRPAPVVLEQVWVEEAKTTVPVRLRRPQYPRGYQPGLTAPSPHNFGYRGEVSYVGDFWAGMYRAARASTIAK